MIGRLNRCIEVLMEYWENDDISEDLKKTQINQAIVTFRETGLELERRGINIELQKKGCEFIRFLGDFYDEDSFNTKIEIGEKIKSACCVLKE